MRKSRLVITTLATPALVAACAGCVLESQLSVQFSTSSPVVVKESATSELTPEHAQGVTARTGQVVGIDCSVTILYDVMDEAGPAVLAQLYRVHLRTRPLPRRTPYALDCTGPLLLEIPTDASGIGATATSASGEQMALPVQAPVTALPIAFGRRLRAEPRTQFAVVNWPRTPPPGDYRIELAFNLTEARAIREKAIYTASVSCGRARYLEPIMPPASKTAAVPALTIQPSPEATSVFVLHIIAANRTYAEATRTLSCPS
jgi:hypothetical protein